MMKTTRLFLAPLAPFAPFLALAIMVSMNSALLAATPASVPGKDRIGQSVTSSTSIGNESAIEKVADSRAVQEQRRAELRAALRAHKRKSDEAAQAAQAASAAASAAQAAQATLTDRYLNAQQRAEMRQQLGQQVRQQRADSESTKP